MPLLFHLDNDLLVSGKNLIPTLEKLIAQKAKVRLGDLAETVSLSLA